MHRAEIPQVDVGQLVGQVAAHVPILEVGAERIEQGGQLAHQEDAEPLADADRRAGVRRLARERVLSLERRARREMASNHAQRSRKWLRSEKTSGAKGAASSQSTSILVVQRYLATKWRICSVREYGTWRTRRDVAS